jgi:voltage-gated potassium channel Kch
MTKNTLSGILFVIVLLSGTLGFLAVEDGWSWLDAFYMTVISVTTVGYGEVHELSTGGRLVAMAVLFCGLGIFGLVLSQITAFVVGGELAGVFDRNALKKRVSGIANHTIVCGLGKRGSWITTRLFFNSPDSLTAIELNPMVDTIVDLKNKGAVVLTGNARDAANLRLIGLLKAAQVVVVAGSDETNLAIAQEIQKATTNLQHPPTIIAAVERYETRSYFSDRLGEVGISLLGFRSQASLWLAHELLGEWVETLNGIPDKPLRLFVQTSEDFRNEIVRAIAMTCQVTAETRPRIHLFQTTREAEERFQDSFPAASECVELHWHHESMESTRINDDLLPEIAIFAMGQDTESLYAAERYLMRRPGMPAERVIACIQDTGDLRDAALRPDPFKREPRILGFYETRRESAPIFSHAMESEGRAIHDNYRSTAIKDNRDPGPWEKLPEFLRDSNRLAAMQRPIVQRFHQRLSFLGIDQAKILTHLTISEHSRWVAFHVMNGWRPSSAVIADRSLRSEARLHHSITSFERLDAPTKALDLANVLQALGLDPQTNVPGMNLLTP